MVQNEDVTVVGGGKGGREDVAAVASAKDLSHGVGGRAPPSPLESRSPVVNPTSRSGIVEKQVRDPAPPTPGSHSPCLSFHHLFAAIAIISSAAARCFPFVVNAYKEEREAFSPHQGSSLFHWTPFGGMIAGQEYGQRTAVTMAFVQAVMYALVLWITVKCRPDTPSPTLKKWLFAHNVVMSIFSGVIVVACALEMYYSSTPDTRLFCTTVETRSFELIQVVWVLSKVYEWVDTIFLLLQHKRPIPLHLWHHCSTTVFFALMTGYSLASKMGILFNGSIHCVMYKHYARPFPQAWRRWLTRFQIIQFATAMAWALYATSNCNGILDDKMFSFVLGNFIVGSYLLLFLQFHVNDMKSRKAHSQK